MEEPSTFLQPRDIAFSHPMKSLNSDITSTELKNMEYETASLENVKQNETTEEIPNWEDTCRVCANCRDHMIPIFENEGAEHNLSNKIHMYLPIEVSKTDSLPLKLCYHCAATLLAWHDLVTGCLDAEKRLLQTQAEMQQKETIQLKNQQISNSNALMDGIITQNEESADDFQSIDTQKLQNPSLPPSSHELQNTEIIQLKYIEKSNLTELSDGNVVENELVDDPEPVETQISEITSLPQKETESSLICEREESCTIQQLEQTSANVEQSSLDQETAERLKKSWTVNPESSDFADFQKVYVNFFGSVKSAKNAKFDHPERSNPDSGATKLSENPEETSTTNASQNKAKIIPSTRITRSNKESIHDEISDNTLPSKDKCETTGYSKTPITREKSTKELNENEADAKISKTMKKKGNSDGPYTCDLCGKKFRLRDSLKSHTRIHTGEKQFTCHICGKQFGQTGCLYYHLKHVHGGVKNHSCDICGRSFAMKTTMEDHRRSIHTGERPFVCDSCGKTFKTKSSLYIHSRTHTESFPHECKYCNKVFRWRQQLLGHLTIHTGEKNHSCDVCGKAFGVKNHLTRHKRTHSVEKPYECQQCDMNFGQKRYLTAHQRSRHK